MVVHLESGHVFSPSTTKAKGLSTTAPCLTSSTLTFLSGDAQQGTSPQNSQELTSTTLKKALSIGYCFDIALAQETCYLTLEDLGPDCQRVLDANDDSCPDYLRLPPFATCKSDCPGGNNELYILKRSILKIFPLFFSEKFWCYRRRRSSLHRLSAYWRDRASDDRSRFVDCRFQFALNN